MGQFNNLGNLGNLGAGFNDDDGSGSPSKTMTKSANAKNMPTMSVNIHQILNAQQTLKEDIFKLHGREFKNVSFVAAVRDRNDSHVNNIVYRVSCTSK